MKTRQKHKQSTDVDVRLRFRRVFVRDAGRHAAACDALIVSQRALRTSVPLCLGG